jgi:hypothetical protein
MPIARPALPPGVKQAGIAATDDDTGECAEYPASIGSIGWID